MYILYLAEYKSIILLQMQYIFMSFVEAVANASFLDVFQWGAMLGLLVFAIYEGYKKRGLNGAIKAINDFFQLGNNAVTIPPNTLADSAYKMSDETKECIADKIEDDEESIFLARVKSMEDANVTSYVLEFSKWWFKIDFGQISDFGNVVKSVTTQEEATE